MIIKIKQRISTVKKIAILGFATFFMLAISPTLLSQNNNQTVAEDASSQTLPDEAFMINLRQADLTNFIEWVAARTGKNIIVDNNVRGKVTIYSNREVSPEEAYTIFLTVLDMNGLAAIDEGSTIKIVQSASAKTTNTPFYDDRSNEKETVTTIIDLIHADPVKITAILRPLIPIATAIQTYEKTFIVTGIAESISKARKLLAILDQPADQVTYDIYAVIHADSAEISKTVKSIIDKLNPPQAKVSGAVFDMVVDERTNSVLIIGDSQQRKKAVNLLKKLDTPLSNEGNTQVVYLNYIEAKEIASILKNVGDGILKKSNDNKTSFSIESSEATNALVITGPNGLLNSLKSIIAKLDIQRAQVMIEAVIVQITGDVDDDFGLIWGGASLYDTNQDGSVAAINVFNSTDALANIANGIDTGTPEALATGFISNPGLTYGYLENGN